MLKPIVLALTLGSVFTFLSTVGSAASGVSATGPATVTVTVFNFGFSAPSGEINVGDTVEWQFPAGIYTHTTTECGASCPPDVGYTPLWSSPVIAAGGTYKVTFDQAGTYQYQCSVHPTLMTGVIVVNGPPTVTPTPTSTPNPVGGIAELPDVDSTGQLEASGSSGRGGGVLAGIVAGVSAAALALGGAAWYARRRLR